MTGSELEAMTFAEFPDSFWERAMTMLYSSYERASTNCWDNHTGPVARNLVPFERRALIEDGIQEVGALFHSVESRSSKALLSVCLTSSFQRHGLWGKMEKWQSDTPRSSVTTWSKLPVCTKLP